MRRKVKKLKVTVSKPKNIKKILLVTALIILVAVFTLRLQSYTGMDARGNMDIQLLYMRDALRDMGNIKGTVDAYKTEAAEQVPKAEQAKFNAQAALAADDEQEVLRQISLAQSYATLAQEQATAAADLIDSAAAKLRNVKKWGGYAYANARSIGATTAERDAWSTVNEIGPLLLDQIKKIIADTQKLADQAQAHATAAEGGEEPCTIGEQEDVGEVTMYCDTDGTLKEVKAVGDTCAEHYECIDQVCSSIDNKCKDYCIILDGLCFVLPDHVLCTPPTGCEG